MNLDKNKLYYLASPYTKYGKGIEAAFEDICKIAAKFIADGICVYSPIAHIHPIAVKGGLDPLDNGIWLPFNVPFMRQCDGGLIVAKMDGWDASFGVGLEIRWFRENRGLEPIYHDQA